MKQTPRERARPETKQRVAAERRRRRSVANLTRMFDHLYAQIDLELTRMAEIQLQFDALRSHVRLL